MILTSSKTFIAVKGGTSSFLFIQRSLLIKLDSVVYLLRYDFIKVLTFAFYDIFKAVIESKDTKIYFQSKFVIFQLNMHLKI